MSNDIESGLIQDIRNLEPNQLSSMGDGSDTGDQKKKGDTDGTDADTDGTDSGDTDGTDAGDTDGTDGGDADGTDGGDSDGTDNA
jgi:hypothetical protein